MKNILKSGVFALITLFALASCAPQESDEYSLGPAPQESQLSFTATPSSGKPNVVQLQDVSSVTGVVLWDLGNGTTAKGSAVQAEYPFAGTYTITMTLYTSGGSASVSNTVTIAQDDMSLLDTPMYNALTGGADNLEGKTWVFDQYNDGHFGVGPVEATTSEWWTCPAEGKTGSSLYTQEFTFIQVGVKMLWKNNGSVYTNPAGVSDLASKGYPNAVATPVDDYDVEYEPNASGYTFSLNETDKTITLSGGAFFGHYAGNSTYEILSLTDDAMYLKNRSALDSTNAWFIRLVPKEKNVKP